MEPYVRQFPRHRILVLGDAILDEYLSGDCGRISPEAPVPVVRVTGRRHVLGGAANTAANIASLGGQVVLVSLVGRDEAGRTLQDCASLAGIHLRAIDDGQATLRKTRVVSQQQQMMRLDHEDIRALSADAERAILAELSRQLPICDGVVVSDYAKGFLTADLAQAIVQRAHSAGRPVIVDPRPQHRGFYAGCDFITPNWREARALLGWADADPTPDAIADVGRALASALGCNVVLTLGPHGIAFFGRDRDESFSQPTLAREVFDVSGAGDTVVAAFALAHVSGMSHADAVAFANHAASVVVGKFGTATVTAAEVLQEDRPRQLIGRDDLAPLANTLRSRGKRLVTVNGSFDLLHSGHLHILTEARQQGDVLIVGLNSDASVRAYKGEGRPIVPEQQRAAMLLALRVVDYVHVFDETTPNAFLAEVRPDVHVNGAEYGENCIESDTVRRGGGRIHLVSRIPEHSTSGLVERLRGLESQQSR
jgi:D-beta-D-heptose 7-phosphate kinase / D-beta-D-heptose 1-phosphate adenosyltransferase